MSGSILQWVETTRLSSELIKFTDGKRVVFGPLTVAVCEVTFVYAFIITVTKMLWKIIMLIWKLVQWMQETMKQL